MMQQIRIVAAGCLLAAASVANAGLTGSSASETYYFPDLATSYGGASYAPASFTIGAGEESVVNVEGVTDIHVDFTDTGLGIVFDTVLNTPTWTATSFNGLVFTGAGLGTITGVTVLGSSFAGFDASRVAVVGNELRLNWGGLGYVNGTTLNLAFTFAAVPEPASWALMIAGFGLTGMTLRRRVKLAA